MEKCVIIESVNYVCDDLSNFPEIDLPQGTHPTDDYRELQS